MSRSESRTATPGDTGRPLETAFTIFLEEGDRSPLVDYLLSRSNLPGPRANLQLLHRFAESVDRKCDEHVAELWDLCQSFVQIPQDKAFAGSPIEFIPMCGTVGFGALGARKASEPAPYFPESMKILKTVAGDARWRVREAVAIALQKILQVSKGLALPVLAGWIEPGQWLQMRAVAAAVAEPPLLKEPLLCSRALELHREIVGHVLDFLKHSHPATLAEVMRSEPFRKLVQALEYSISVVVASDPEEGFPFLRELVALAVNGRENPDTARAAAVLRKIVKGNLRKNRLVRAYPQQIDELVGMLY